MALDALENQALLDTLNSERFVDTAPAAGHVGHSDWQTDAVYLIEDAQGRPLEIVAELRAVKPARAPAAVHPAPQAPLLRRQDAHIDPAFAVV